MIPKELRIPGFDIEVLLGKGGMAAVYQARQQSFGREVALKVLNPSAEDLAEFSRRFLQESTIVAKLHHSHIVQVYDVGQHGEYFYISMEYLHGGDLTAKLKEGLRLKDSVRIICQLADALDFAHRKNIIHRDIKPANIMFREDGAAVLTDFGIAKELESQSELTQAGVVIGTPRYMSPEQIRGEKVDHRADIYSLGIVFYRCLTNYVPFDGKDMLSTAYLQDNEPVPALPPEVACFQPIINRMLEKSPATRFQRGREIVEALDQLDRSAYKAEMTNLDVAAANQLSPPTVTSVSGRYSVAASVPSASDSDMDGTQMRARTGMNATVIAEHMQSDVPAPIARPAANNSQRRTRSDARVVLLLCMLLSVMVFASTRYADKATMAYGSALAANLVSRAQAWWADSSPFQNKADRESDSSHEAIVAAESDKTVPPVTAGAEILSEMTIEPTSSQPAALDGPTDGMTPPEFASETADGTASELPVDAHTADAETSMVAESVSEGEPEVADVQAEEIVPAQPDPAAQVAALLAAAEIDMAAKRYRKPADDNAYSKFTEVLALDTGNISAMEGIARIADAYRAMAERAIREKQFSQAESAINDLKVVAPTHTAIAKLEASLAQAIALQQEQEALAAAAEKEAKIESLLAAAGDDESAGRIRSPVGNNALEKYQQVLDLDPNNTLAINKLIEYGR